MIKLHLHLNHFNQKILVDISIEQQPTILSFLTRVLHICSISNVDPHQIQLYDGEYILPHLLSSKYIKSDGNYTVRNMKIGKKEAKEKKQKEGNNKRIVESEIESSSEEENVAIQNKIQNKHKKLIPINNHLPSQKQEESQSHPKKSFNNKNQHQIVSSSDSSSDSDDSLPVISKRKQTGQNSKTAHEENQKNISKKYEKVSTDKSLSLSEKIKSNNIITKVQEILSTVNSKSHINNNDQGQEKVSTEPIVKKNELAKTVVESKNISEKVKINNNTSEAKPQFESVNEKQSKIIPEIGRLKEFHSFKEYQESKWISITKENLKEWENVHQDIPIFDPENSIRFKVIELDEEKFVPVTTGWISGTIEKSEKKGSNTFVNLINVSKCPTSGDGSSEFLKEFSVPLHNMQELQINKGTLTSLQKEIIKAEEQKKEHTQQRQIQEATNKEPEKQEQTLNDYVCSQINYYFSEKNYPQDLFLIMNANKDAEKYIDVRLMTNFGKIKKVVTDEKKVWEFLANDEKLKSRNYELDLKRRMLRRR